jgi:magnesium chelatase family protein
MRGRIRSAIISSHLKWPDYHITVNLAPAESLQQSARYDLPVALGLLIASQQLPKAIAHNREFFGELGLDGSIRQCRGLLSAVVAATQAGCACGVAIDGASELASVTHSRIIAAPDLLSLCGQLQQPNPTLTVMSQSQGSAPITYPDLSAIRGQPLLCRALELAATGGHHLLISGPPGIGKTLAASVLPGLLPPVTPAQRREVGLLRDLAGLPHCEGPPFRAPHHSSSIAALMGGTSRAIPGEISMAHAGVLFLDELAEFPRAVLNQLRQPLETGEITVSRAAHQHTYPAQFQLVAAMNPCPCGMTGRPESTCRCTPIAIQRYWHGVSGPLLDRIDLHITIDRPPPDALLSKRPTKDHSQTVRDRVTQLREQQLARQDCLNSALEGDQLISVCRLAPKTQTWFVAAIKALSLSARSAHRRLRVARTLADLGGHDAVSITHVETALSFREIDSQSAAKRA